MIRETLIPKQNEITISLPDDYVGKQVELLAFLNEEIHVKQVKTIKRPFKVVDVKLENYSFNREEANER